MTLVFIVFEKSDFCLLHKYFANVQKKTELYIKV